MSGWCPPCPDCMSMGADSSSNWREKQTKKQRSWKMWFQRSSFIRESNFCFLFYICLYSVGLSLYFLLLLSFCIIDDDKECSMSGCRTMSFSTRGNTEFFNGFDRWKFYDAVFRRIAGSVHFGLDKSNRITRTKHSRWAIICESPISDNDIACHRRNYNSKLS